MRFHNIFSWVGTTLHSVNVLTIGKWVYVSYAYVHFSSFIHRRFSHQHYPESLFLSRLNLYKIIISRNLTLSLKLSDIRFYLTLCTFSFESNEICCLIQDVVSPHCGDKRMAWRCSRRSLPNYFDMMSYHWNVWQNTVGDIGEWTEKIMWRHAQNVVSLRVLYTF